MKTVRDACKQAMGGGKTHLLVGFGLLARFPALRRKNCGGTMYASSFDTARIAAFNGRNHGDLTQRTLAVELSDHRARRLEEQRPQEASAARVLRELIKNQRLG